MLPYHRMGEHSSVLKTLMTVMTSGQDGKRKALQPLTLKNRGDCGCCGWMSTTLWKIRPFLLADFKGEEEVLKLCGLIISALHRAQGTGHRAQARRRVLQGSRRYATRWKRDVSSSSTRRVISSSHRSSSVRQRRVIIHHHHQQQQEINNDDVFFLLLVVEEEVVVVVQLLVVVGDNQQRRRGK